MGSYLRGTYIVGLCFDCERNITIELQRTTTKIDYHSHRNGSYHFLILLAQTVCSPLHDPHWEFSIQMWGCGGWGTARSVTYLYTVCKYSRCEQTLLLHCQQPPCLHTHVWRHGIFLRNVWWVRLFNQFCRNAANPHHLVRKCFHETHGDVDIHWYFLKFGLGGAIPVCPQNGGIRGGTSYRWVVNCVVDLIEPSLNYTLDKLRAICRTNHAHIRVLINFFG